MQPRGKTCLLQHTQLLVKQKSEKVHQKKALCENRRAEKSVEKMQARGKTCLLQYTKTTSDPKVRKGAPKTNIPQKYNDAVQITAKPLECRKRMT